MGLVSLSVLLAASVAVRPGGGTLRTGCEAADSTVTSLPAETAVEVRFAMSGSKETCYKVSAMHEGKPVQGYLTASELSGLGAFEAERVSAPSITTASLPPTAKAAVAEGPANHPLVQASKLIESKQPRAALDLAERSMKAYGRDYNALLLAGIAAYQSDDLPRALDYLKQAQGFRQDRLIEQWIAKIEKEAGGDRSAERLYGTRFVLRYEGGQLHPDVARTMVATLEQEFSRISAELGCRTDERIVTVVQSRSAYFASTGAESWSGGLFDGKIRVPIAANATVTPEIRRAFSHELVHACLAQMGSWPAWLHEGLAQHLSGDRLPARDRALVRAAVLQNRTPKLSGLVRSWASMDPQYAELAYAHSLAAVELMMERYRAYGIHNILRNPERLPAIAADLEKLLLE